MSTILFVPKELEARNEKLYDALVPPSDKCDTVEGEMLRAINRVLYRFYNDGDYWYDGYGCETAGPAVAYLTSPDCPLDLRAEFEASDCCEDADYERPLHKALERIVDYVERADGHYRPNKNDMLEYKPKYEWEDEYGDDDDYSY